MLHEEAIPARTLDLLRQMMAFAPCASFALGGGTALALRIGHRLSVDLDLFTPSPFDAVSLQADLADTFSLNALGTAPNTLNLRVESIKVDLIRYGYAQLQDCERIDGLRLISLPDIAAMKLSALTNRGSRKDFYDIARLCQLCGLPQLLAWYEAKFPHTDIFPTLKALTYFKNAENQPDPVLLDCPSWDTARDLLLQAVNEL